MCRRFVLKWFSVHALRNPTLIFDKTNIKIMEPANGTVTLSTADKILLKKDQITKGTVNISFPEKEIKLSKQKVKIGVYDQKGELLDTFETYFEGPFKLQF